MLYISYTSTFTESNTKWALLPWGRLSPAPFSLTTASLSPAAFSSMAPLQVLVGAGQEGALFPTCLDSAHPTQSSWPRGRILRGSQVQIIQRQSCAKETELEEKRILWERDWKRNKILPLPKIFSLPSFFGLIWEDKTSTFCRVFLQQLKTRKSLNIQVKECGQVKHGTAILWGLMQSYEWWF